jgi:hypothetical protein
MGDFNLIYRATQKNNNRINFRMMNRFKTTLESLDLKELHLHDRRFTWSSGTEEPTFTKIDHMFYTEPWELDHPNYYLQALSSSMSDHCPLLLTYMPVQRGKRAFRFESYWAQLPNFMKVAQQSWARDVQSGDKLRVLHIKLSRPEKALKNWSKQHVMDLRLKAQIATKVVAPLDQAQENCSLSTAELASRKTAKAHIIGSWFWGASKDHDEVAVAAHLDQTRRRKYTAIPSSGECKTAQKIHPSSHDRYQNSHKPNG